MSINGAMSPIPYKGIPGFDNLASDVVGIIAEYAGCIAGPEDQPSWSVDRHHECLRVLFAPRLHPVRLSHTAHWNNELNKEYAFYQNYKRIENLWKMTKWLLSNHLFSIEGDNQDLHNIANDRTFYSLPTFRQHWFAYLGSLHQAFVENTPPRHLAHLSPAISSADENALLELGRANLQTPSSDPRILDIQSACNVLDQANNGVTEVVFPTQRLRAIVQSTQETFYADIASCEAQGVQSARNVQPSTFMKVLACAVAVCLIARRILSQIVPMVFCQAFLLGLIQGLATRLVVEFALNGPSAGLARIVKNVIPNITPLNVTGFIAGGIVAFHAIIDIYFMTKMGPEGAWEIKKEIFKTMIRHIQTIWRSRELITDVYIKGATAHASMVMESIRKLGPIKGLRHGYRVLSRIAREGLA